jgi:hypothetical protein
MQAARRDLRPWAVLGPMAALLATGILVLNRGRFVYALDDPCIHLAISENLLHLTYGVNAGETASASSSIIYPVLLAPFAPWRIHEYVPLAINLLAAGTVAALLAGLPGHGGSPPDSPWA